jgi:hypothetical protein
MMRKIVQHRARTTHLDPLRVATALSQLLGFAITRYIARVGPLAALSLHDAVSLIAPSIEPLLVPIGSPAANA